MKAAIICANGCEECEALLTYDLLYRAEIEVKLIGLDSIDVKSSHELVFKCDESLKDCDIKNYDCLILPGGMPGAKNLEESKEVQNLIDYYMDNNKLIAALCSAPSILIHKGLLNDNEFTCFPGCEEDKKPVDTKAYKYKNIITGNGLGGTIEFAEMIISSLKDPDTAKSILKRIQYIK